jgi:hypothetical protein
MTFKPGDRVRFTAESLGVIDPSDPHHFMDVIVKAGDEGEILTYDDQMPDGWLAVRADAAPNGYVPVHPSMIEAA